MHSQGGSQDGAAATKIQRAVLVLSLGSRPFFKVTRPLIENFAARVSATLHVLSSVEHPALQPHMRRLKSTPRFLKLPALHYYLQRYNQVLFFDDDVVVSPRMADIFEAVRAFPKAATASTCAYTASYCTELVLPENGLALRACTPLRGCAEHAVHTFGGEGETRGASRLRA